MARPLLYVPPGGGLFLVSTRTMQSRFLLRPGPRLNQLVAGVIGRAQRRYAMEIIAGVALSNHYHLLLQVNDALQLASFMNFVNSNIARKAGRLHRWREKFWGRRYRPTLVSDEPEAQIERLHYVLSQGCKEGLVAGPRDWPGVSCVRPLVEGRPLEGVWENRTARFRASLRGEKHAASSFDEPERVAFSPLPCWRHLSPSAYARRMVELVTRIEQETARDIEQTGRQPLGPDRILRQHPHDRPPRSERSPAPLIHAATKQVRIRLRAAYSLFVLAYRSAAERLRAGDRQVDFPEGCFPPRLPYVQQRLAPG